jgi:BACON domain-containing protein
MMQQCKMCGSIQPPDAAACGMCGQTLSNTAEEVTLISNAGPSANADWSTTLISEHAPTFISGAAHLARASDELGPLEKTHVLSHPAQGDDQPTLVLDKSERAEDDEERKRRALLDVALAGLLESSTPQAGHVPMVQGTPSLSGVPAVPGTPPAPGGMPAGNAAPAPAPAGSAPSHREPGHGAHTPPSHTPPADHLEHEHHETGHHHGSEHHHRSEHHHGSEHHHESGRRHERGHRRLPRRRGCAITVLVAIGAGVIIFTLIISGWFFPGHPRLTLTGDGHVTRGDDLHVHGSGFPGGISITLEIDDGSLFSAANQRGGVQSYTVASTGALADALFWQQQHTGSPSGTLTVHSDGTFDATIHIGQNWPMGRHLIHALEKGRAVQVDLAFFVDAPPSQNTQPSQAKLLVNRTTLDFGRVTTGDKPVGSVTLSNTGTGGLVWTADTGGAAWLKLASEWGSIGAGDPPQVLQLVADTSSLAPGMYQALLHIRSNGGNAQVQVSLLVAASTTPIASKPAHLTANATTLDFGQVGAGTVASQSITLGNDGQQVLTWTASADGSGWWGIANPGGSIQPGGSSSLTVTIKTAGLSSGSHAGVLVIDSNGGTVSVPIQVTISASPAPAHLTVSSTSIDFGSVQQGNAAQQSLSLGNNGGQSLNWSASTNGAVWWGINTTTGIVQPGGSQPLTLSAKTGGLKPGNYSGTLTISSNGGTVTIPISLTVTAPPQPPCITVDQQSISLTVKQGTTTGQNVVFTNCGQVTGNVSIVANAANGSGWLSIAELSGGPIGGTYPPGASQTISINLDATKLPPGKYSGTVTATITTSASLSQSVTVNVTLTVL